MQRLYQRCNSLVIVLQKLWLGASLEPELSSAGAELSQVLHMVLSIYNFGHRAGRVSLESAPIVGLFPKNHILWKMRGKIY